jgi:hypothetical protein
MVLCSANTVRGCFKVLTMSNLNRSSVTLSLFSVRGLPAAPYLRFDDIYHEINHYDESHGHLEML